MGDEFTTSTAASSFSELAATRVAKYTFSGSYSASPKYTPEQLVAKLVKSVKSSDLEGDELRALVGEIITNQLYEIIKERES